MLHLPVIAADPGSLHSILVGANLGLTLWATAVDTAVILFTLGAALRVVYRRMWTVPAIVCVMANAVAVGQMIFSARRVVLQATGSPTAFAQPTWSIATVVIGSAVTTIAPVAAMIWYAHVFRPRTGRVVAAINVALFFLSLAAGALAASW